MKLIILSWSFDWLIISHVFQAASSNAASRYCAFLHFLAALLDPLGFEALLGHFLLPQLDSLCTISSNNASTFHLRTRTSYCNQFRLQLQEIYVRKWILFQKSSVQVSTLLTPGVLSVIVSKVQGRSIDQGRPILFKFVAIFLYQIRLQSVVFFVK